MDEDKLTDFERAEYYKQRLKSKTAFWITFSILMFLTGFLAARALYMFLCQTHKI